jgi:uncharacterized membrane protein SpoIIM required for sporulation
MADSRDLAGGASRRELDNRQLQQLERLVARASLGVTSLSEEELVELPRLYRHASSQLARLETNGHDAARLAKVRALVVRAHGLLYREERGASGNLFARAARFVLIDSPRAIRAEARLLGALFLLFYGLSTITYVAVLNDLELAYALQPAAFVDAEIEQLRETETGESFRGNFTFGLGESPRTAGWILAHNITVSMIFFGTGLLPPLYAWVLGSNALMLGTYTGVAAHWGQAGSISSILWCHGVIELQMIVLAGAAGLVLIRAWIAPGPWSRRHAMKLESRRAWALLAPVFPFLTLSGLIEGYVSPHAPFGVRIGVAIASGVLLVAWVWNGSRERAA